MCFALISRLGSPLHSGRETTPTIGETDDEDAERAWRSRSTAHDASLRMPRARRVRPVDAATGVANTVAARRLTALTCMKTLVSEPTKQPTAFRCIYYVRLRSFRHSVLVAFRLSLHDTPPLSPYVDIIIKAIIYTVNHKTPTESFVLLCQMRTDFNYSFTVAFTDELRKKL